MRLFFSVCLFLVVGNLNGGCSKADQVGFGIPPGYESRSTEISPSFSFEGEAPLTVEFSITIRHGKEDTGRKETVVDRVEIDFGDGAGWTDVTKDVNEEYKYDNLGAITFVETEHVYGEPGAYVIRMRATYWDGEVLYNDYPPIITVLPGEGGGISKFEKNLNRDTDANDRLYVGSAGNQAENKVAYPAGYQRVLGVSGLWTDRDGTNWYNSWNNGGSNYRDDNYYTYPVSGIYGFMDFTLQNGYDSGHMSTVTPGISDYPDGIDEDDVQGDGIIGEYQYYTGTSASAAQVSALAFHLYTAKPYSTYEEVREQIISTKNTSTTRGSISGVVNYQLALSSW